MYTSGEGGGHLHDPATSLPSESKPVTIKEQRHVKQWPGTERKQSTINIYWKECKGKYGWPVYLRLDKATNDAHCTELNDRAMIC